MRRMSVYLTDDDAARLRRLARIEDTSQAEIIRRAIRRYVPQATGDRDFVSAAVADGPGGSVADVPEHDLLKDFGER